MKFQPLSRRAFHRNLLKGEINKPVSGKKKPPKLKEFSKKYYRPENRANFVAAFNVKFEMGIFFHST